MREPGVLAFRVTVPRPYEDQLLCLLWECGTQGVLHAPEDGAASVLIAYFPGEAGAETGLLDRLRSVPGTQAEPVDVPRVDWVARFCEGFHAFHAGAFCIVPVWDETVPGPRTLVVDPGRGFGTGTHQTTRLCLACLERLAAGPGLGRVLDIGTGSGLLAIAALRLGARAALGVDHDPEAILSAARHAQLNQVSLPLLAGDAGRPLQRGRFDTVVANLTAPLLIEKSLELDGLRSARGRLVLSGLLAVDMPDLCDAYGSLGPLEESRDGEWAALVVGPTGT